MDNVNALSPLILTWLLNYLVHSSILLGIAVITHQFGILKPSRFAELIWRAALFGSLVTASLQLGLQLALQAPEIKNESLSREHLIAAPSASFSPEVSEVSISDKRILEASAIAASPLPNDSTINTQLTENITRASDNKVITLPANLQNIISALILTWLLYGGFSILKILRAVRHLNRMANAMPVVDRSDLNELLVQYLPHSNNIARLRISRDFNSPFVCPNGVICLPSWALEQSNQAVCQAMLHHEIQHIIRRDGAWRIAHALMNNIFFFQVLNRAAEKQLMLLAEIDCDQTAVRANGVDTFAQALVRCAEMAVASKHPTFATPMANSTSLIQRIDSILDEDNMNNTQSDIRKNKAIGIILSLFAAAITITVPTTSIAFINTDNSSIVSSPTPISKHDASTSVANVKKHQR
jgi:beta-lactamase regulating signal transducer with metallopeptidase domain